uniref:Uncharacterized protein n=1 Tax=Neospora caninum (strain Liverpool) TaxID=572307 RepID=A0A0F7UJG5_NEOCL|nr:TPA: hypothetical protein BN1204_040310 [Neospora caninum Liverpool]
MYPPPSLPGRAPAPPDSAPPPPQGFLRPSPSSFPRPPAYFPAPPAEGGRASGGAQRGAPPPAFFSSQTQFASTYAVASQPLPPPDPHEVFGGRPGAAAFSAVSNTMSAFASFSSSATPGSRRSPTASGARMHATNLAGLRSGVERRQLGPGGSSQSCAPEGLPPKEELASGFGYFGQPRDAEGGFRGYEAERFNPETTDPLSRHPGLSYGAHASLTQVHGHQFPPFSSPFPSSASAACTGVPAGPGFEIETEGGSLAQVYVQGKSRYGVSSQSGQRWGPSDETEGSGAERREGAGSALSSLPPKLQADGYYVPRTGSAQSDFHFSGVRPGHLGGDIPPPPAHADTVPPAMGVPLSQRMQFAADVAAPASSRPLPVACGAAPRSEGREKPDDTADRDRELSCFYDSGRDPRVVYGARSRRAGGSGGEGKATLFDASFPFAGIERGLDLPRTKEDKAEDKRGAALPGDARAAPLVKTEKDAGTSQRSEKLTKEWKPVNLLPLQLEPVDRVDDALHSPLLPDIDSLCDPYTCSSALALEAATPLGSDDEAGFVGSERLEKKRADRDRSRVAEKAQASEAADKTHTQAQGEKKLRFLSCADPLQAVWRLPLERFNPCLLVPRIVCEEEGWLPGTTTLAAYGLPPDLSASLVCELLLDLFFSAAGISCPSASSASPTSSFAPAAFEDPAGDDLGFLSLYDPLLPPSAPALLPPAAARSPFHGSHDSKEDACVWRRSHAPPQKRRESRPGSPFSPLFSSPKQDLFAWPRPTEKPLMAHADAVGLERVELIVSRADESSEKYAFSDDFVSPLLPVSLSSAYSPASAAPSVFARCPSLPQQTLQTGREDEKSAKTPFAAGLVGRAGPGARGGAGADIFTNLKRKSGRDLSSHSFDLLRSQRAKAKSGKPQELPGMALLKFASERDAKRFWLVFSTGNCQAYGYTLLLSPDPSGLAVYTEALASSVSLSELRVRVETLGPFPLQRKAPGVKPLSPSALPLAMALRPSASSAKPVVAECPLVSSESLALAREAAAALNAACRWNAKSQKCEFVFPSEDALLLPCVALHTFPPASDGHTVTALLLAVPTQRLASSAASRKATETREGTQVELRLLPLAVRDLWTKKETRSGSGPAAPATRPLPSGRGAGKAGGAHAALAGSAHLTKSPVPPKETETAGAAAAGEALEAHLNSMFEAASGGQKGLAETDAAAGSGAGDAGVGSGKRRPVEGQSRAGAPLAERPEERTAGKGDEQKGRQPLSLARGAKPPPVVAQRSNVCAAKKRPGAGAAGSVSFVSGAVGSAGALGKGAPGAGAEDAKSDESQGKAPSTQPPDGPSLHPAASPLLSASGAARAVSAPGIRAAAAKSAIGRGGVGGFAGTPQTPDGAPQRGTASLPSLAGKGEGPKGARDGSVGRAAPGARRDEKEKAGPRAEGGGAARAANQRRDPKQEKAKSEGNRRGGPAQGKRGRARRRGSSESDSSSESSESSNSSNSSESSSSDEHSSSSEDEDSRKRKNRGPRDGRSSLGEEKRSPVKKHRLVRHREEETEESEAGSGGGEKHAGQREEKEEKKGARGRERRETGEPRRSASLSSLLSKNEEDGGPPLALFGEDEAEKGDEPERDRSGQGSEEDEDEKLGGAGKRKRPGVTGRGRKRGRGKRDEPAKASTPQPAPTGDTKRRPGRGGRRSTPHSVHLTGERVPAVGEREAGSASATLLASRDEKGVSLKETPLLPAHARLCFSPTRPTTGNASLSSPSRPLTSGRSNAGDRCGDSGAAAASSPRARTPEDGTGEGGEDGRGRPRAETPLSAAHSGRTRGSKRRRSEGSLPPRRSIRLRGDGNSASPFSQIPQAPSFPAVPASPPSVSSPASVASGGGAGEMGLLARRGRVPQSPRAGRVGSGSPHSVSLFVDGEGEDASPGAESLSGAASPGSRGDRRKEGRTGDSSGDGVSASGAVVESNTVGRLSGHSPAGDQDGVGFPSKRKGKGARQ